MLSSCEKFLDLSPLAGPMHGPVFRSVSCRATVPQPGTIKNGSIVLDHLYTDPHRALGRSLSQSLAFFSVTHCSPTGTAGKCEGGNERTSRVTSQLLSRQLDLREWPRRSHPGPLDTTEVIM